MVGKMRQFEKESQRFTTFFFYRSKGRKFVVCRENTNSCRKRRSFRRKTRTTSQRSWPDKQHQNQKKLPRPPSPLPCVASFI